MNFDVERDEILSLWKQDSIIDHLDIKREILRSSSLHYKYMEKLLIYKDMYRKIDSNLVKLKKIKTKYYKGEMNKDDLSIYGWLQYQGVKPVKAELEHLLNTDEDIMILNNNLISCKILLDMVESILSQIKSRSYDLKTYIEAEKFYAGN